MRLAIMQPYFFPYIGYFQLINAVDKFVIYDDVNFIKKGWINRNNILLNGQPHTFSVPLEKISQNKKINEINLAQDEKWRRKTLQTFQHAYKKAPNFQSVAPLIEEIINYETQELSSFLLHSIQRISQFLSLNSDIIPSSVRYDNANLSGADRIIDICVQEKTECYVNAIGGKDLYDPPVFESKGIELKFLKTREFDYKQFDYAFTSHLSIIDNMMFQSLDELRQLLNHFELVN